MTSARQSQPHTGPLRQFGLIDYIAAPRSDLFEAGERHDSRIGQFAVSPDASRRENSDHVPFQHFETGDAVDHKFWFAAKFLKFFEANDSILSHCNSLPGAKTAREEVEHNLCGCASKFDSAPHYYGRLRVEVDSISARYVPTTEQLSGTHPYNPQHYSLHSGALA
jgi:hypothetical protein